MKAGTNARYENQRHRASGLNLVVAAIVLWNTVYLERTVTALRDRGQPISDELLAHLSPLGWEHINLTGDYVWRPDGEEYPSPPRQLRLPFFGHSDASASLAYNFVRSEAGPHLRPMDNGRGYYSWSAVPARQQRRRHRRDRLTENAVWWIVREYAGNLELGNLAPHDLRRTCARLCRASGGALEQIQLLLGHQSIQTTMNYLGIHQNLVEAVNDRLGIAE